MARGGRGFSAQVPPAPEKPPLMLTHRISPRLVGNHEGCPYKCNGVDNHEGCPRKCCGVEGAFPRRSLQHLRPKTPKTSAGHNRLLTPQRQFAEKQPPPACSAVRRACLCVARRQAGRRPSFSAFFLGGQRTSTCRFTSSAFLPLSSQERGPGG